MQGLCGWDSIAVIAVLSSAISIARYEEGVVNTAGNSRQLLLAASRETTHHFAP